MKDLKVRQPSGILSNKFYTQMLGIEHPQGIFNAS